MKIGDVIVLSETERKVVADYIDRISAAKEQQEEGSINALKHRKSMWAYLHGVHPEMEGCEALLLDEQGILVATQTKKTEEARQRLKEALRALDAEEK